MFKHFGRSELFDQILIPKDNKAQTAKSILQRFTCDNSLPECKSFLWTMVETCLTTDHFNFSTPDDRMDLMNMHRHFQELFEAVFVIAEHWNNEVEAI